MLRWARVTITGAMVCLAAAVAMLMPATASDEGEITQGALQVTGQPGQRLLEFPLQHTAVEADIAGLIAKVTVTQEFGNPYADPIEAVYVFPLPENSAVNDMVMKIGDRTIRADIQTREAARETYEAARAAGQRAALLEQERPNIFTQSVANILPGDRILITITYVQDLKYDHGTYELNFPMVVGPRYIPGSPAPDPPKGGGWAPDTTRVPDASRITPPVLRPEERSGHDISLHVRLDAGVPIRDLRCASHEVVVERESETRADIALHPKDTIPNKDFILRYDVAGEVAESAFLPYHGKEGGYFLLMVQPKADYTPGEITPKEMVFVVDRSGSMSGQPIEKCQEAMRRCLRGMNGDDTFQIIGFSNEATTFAPAPVPNTSENVEKAIAYVDAFDGNGGTEMLEGIKKALDYKPDPKRMRIVFFMTDGYIGNETEIFAAIQERLGGARLFSFGVGSSVNHYLLGGMAKFGRGMVQYVRPDEDTKECVDRFYDRIARPYLTDVAIEAQGIELKDLYPQAIPDLFSAQPIEIHGRYDTPGTGAVRITGKVAGKPWETTIPVSLPGGESGNAALASLWARQKMGDLMDSMARGENAETVQQITDLALEFRLMSPYTSFVAVEEKVVNENGQVRTVQVPVPMPEGVRYEGVFGEKAEGFGGMALGASMVAPSVAMARKGGSGPAGPTGVVTGALTGAPMAEEPEVDGARYGTMASWICVLASEGVAVPYLGLGTALVAAGSVVQAPNMGPGYLPPEGMALPLADNPAQCLVITGATTPEQVETCAAGLRQFVADGRTVLVDSQDPGLLAALAKAGLEVSDLPADCPVLTAKGTAYDLGPVEGLRGLTSDGKLVGFVLPGVLASLADGISDDNMPNARLMTNVVSFALQEMAKRPKPAAEPANEE